MNNDLVQVVANESTCHKRVTVCLIFDANGVVVASEANRCNPPGGKCQRLCVSQGKGEYPSDSTCNWEHAERRAAGMVRADAERPLSAIVYGHDFACADCEALLKSIGVKEILIQASGFGTGLR